MTETSPAAIANPLDLDRVQRRDRPADAVDRHLRFATTTAATSTSAKPGELCIKGPQVMAGYWNRPDETAKVMTADGCLRTGDIGVMDERGYVYIVDRKKDMIIRLGLQRLSERNRGRGR